MNNDYYGRCNWECEKGTRIQPLQSDRNIMGSISTTAGGLSCNFNATATATATKFNTIGRRRSTLRSSFWYCAAFFLVPSFALACAESTHTAAIFDVNWELVETYKHDRASFTQGLEIHPSSVTQGTCDASPQCSSKDITQPQERLLVTESTGMYGDSLLRVWDLVTGEVHEETKMDPRFFGEGSTFFVDDNGKQKIAVLTYREESILVYDAKTLQLVETIQTWPSPTTTREGWGIAFDPFHKVFMVTDGSEYIHFWNTNFEELDAEERPKVAVRIEELVAPSPDGSTQQQQQQQQRQQQRQVLIPYNADHPGTRISLLNELEWDASTNTLLANRWGEEIILRIDPTSGIITRVYDFSALYPKHSRGATPPGYRNEDVFNGITIVPNTDGKEWLVTGKWWPNIYRIRIKE